VQTQVSRGLQRRLQSGDASVGTLLQDSRKALERAVAALDARLKQPLSYPLADAWQPVRAQLLALTAGQLPASPADAFAAHSSAIDALYRLVLLNAERSGLVLDPEAVSYHLMDLVVNDVIPVAESAAVVRGIGSGLLARGSATPLELAEVLGQAGLLRRSADDMASAIGALGRAGSSTPGSWPSMQASLQAFGRTSSGTFSASSIHGDAAAFFQLGTAAVSETMALTDDLLARLDASLAERQRSIERRVLVHLAISAVGLAVLAYLLAAFTLSIRRSLRELHDCASAIAAGDLSRHMTVEGRDELAEIGNVMEGMTQRLSSLVSDIRNSAALVNQTGQQVSEGSGKLAVRTDEQASNLRSSVTAIHQLSSAVADNAQAARQLNELTRQLSNQAEEGNAAMGDTVAAMQRMQEASQRVAEVVAVIDDVAFQTSILSLNAAIEAARAGEAGKGFAVVASEVRQLAQRCAESADEIRLLIGHASEQVSTSADKLGHVSGALGTIVDGVREVSTRLRSISDSSSEQSEGLQEVTASVGNLDEITRQNARLVEESTAASNALVERAGMLREAVASMRLRKGSADEAMALVRRALAHLEAVGRAQALVDFHDPQGSFIDRDLYVFAIDREGSFAVFGARPEVVGQGVGAVPGLDGEFVRKCWMAAEAGGGWVQYDVVSPISGEIMGKESYICDDGAGHAMGCGFYRNEEETAATSAKPRAAAWDRNREQAHAVAGA
jgi:methyl-accepting chemotaxis protein